MGVIVRDPESGSYLIFDGLADGLGRTDEDGGGVTVGVGAGAGDSGPGETDADGAPAFGAVWNGALDGQYGYPWLARTSAA
jgi:hypothetical protein